MKETSEQHLSKLNHLTGFMWANRFTPLALKINDKGDVVTHVDGAHEVHNDDKGHSGLFLTMRKGAMTNSSKKLGFITTSSIETEIVADGKIFPKCSWFRHFRLA